MSILEDAKELDKELAVELTTGEIPGEGFRDAIPDDSGKCNCIRTGDDEFRSTGDLCTQRIVLFSLAVDNYAPEMMEITLPLMANYAGKIGATFCLINKRMWPDLPPVMEKFQIYYLAQQDFRDYDWFIFFDADTLIHPDMFNPCAVLDKSTTCSGISSDFTPNRFRPDAYFRRDGRYIGKGNWCAIFSNWCLDYYTPPDPMTLPHIQYLARNIRLTAAEQKSGVMQPSHLIDDYIVSRNIARFGLKHTLLSELGKRFGHDPSPYLWHQYLHDREKKVLLMRELLGPPTPQHPERWGIQMSGKLEIAPEVVK